MAQNAVLTQGTILARGNGATPTEVFANVIGVVSITGPDATKAEIDVTDLASAAKEFKGGLADFGRMSCEIQYIPTDATHQLIRADFVNAASPVNNWKLTMADGSVMAFTAYVTGMPMNVAADNVIRATLNLRMTGLPVLTPGP
jgi:Lambda phage tail tube protein, TTP